eukprot:gene19428-25306_t
MSTTKTIPRVSSTTSELSDFTEKDGKKIYNVSRSRLIGLINWVHVFRTYLPIVWFLVVGILIVQILTTLINSGFNLQSFYASEISVIDLREPLVFNLGWKTMTIIALLIWYINHREKPVYLIDFSTFQPPEDWKVSPDEIVQILSLESIAFQERMLRQSGCGPRTAWPPGILNSLRGEPTDRSIEASRKESEVVMFDCVRKVLEKTKIHPKSIDILVVNCSLFAPTPSLTSMIINEFGMRPDISSYNLSGMGCSASLISIELVKNILAGRPHSTALIVSTEIITPNLYHGNEKSFLLQNTLFRCGGAAMILSNKWFDGFHASLKLLNVVRTQYVSDDSFGCVYETEDPTDHRGVRLSKDIVKIAGRAMERNFTTLGPYVLPLSEQLKTLFWMIVRYALKKLKEFGYQTSKVDPYIPDFKRAIDHFCIHAGGRGVIDGIEKNLQLTPRHVEASRHALYTYGNTSSSSIWYELDYVRNHLNLHRGQRVLQVAFGSGFKCNSAVWLCINNKKSLKHNKNGKKED